MGATQLAGAFDVAPLEQFQTYGFVNLATSPAAQAAHAEATAKAEFLVKYGHAVPANLMEASALDDMVRQAKLRATQPGAGQKIEYSPTITPNGMATGGGVGPATPGPTPGVPMVVVAGMVGASAFLLWPRGSAPAPKRRRGRRASTRRRRRNPRARRGTPLLVLAGVGLGALWAARRLAGQVSAVAAIAEERGAIEWADDGRAAGLGCGPCLAGASTPGYYL